MKKIFFLFFILILGNASGIYAQKYACFKSETDKNTQLTVYFENKKAVYIKFKGQKKAIPLIYADTKQTDNIGGGSPAFFWTETYLVKTGKKVTGSYVFTNGGAFELNLTYISSNTKTKMPFTIIESLAGENFSAYRDTPCF